MNRDRKLEHALKHELRSAVTPIGEPALRSFSEGGCVDAETLGAWADGGLDAIQMASVETHVADCARCQAILGATARSAPAAEATEAPAGFSMWKWWLAPVAAGAAAVTLWMVVPQGTTPVPPAAPIVSEAKTEAPAQVKEQAAAPQRERVAQPRFDDRQEQGSERLERKQENRVADQTSIGSVAAPPAPARPAESAGLAGAAREATLQKATGVNATLQVVSPDPGRRWRVTSGAIERSEDGGVSWTQLLDSSGDNITAGTSPAGSICWLIGANGMVLVTADGSTFARVPIPERVALASITATDARSAVVTTADGRRYRTDDAGRNWQRN
jgi:hypothetical protein